MKARRNRSKAPESPGPRHAGRRAQGPQTRKLALGDPWRFLEIAAVALTLIGFYALLISSVVDKSPAFDEPVHMTAGVTYWRLGDYRVDPENGNLPQRLAGLPLVLGEYRLPTLDQPAWRFGGSSVVAFQFLHECGNNLQSMLLLSHAVMGLLAMALGLVVYLWSRQLFGPGGAFVSLGLYVFSPIVLANGALATSDMAGALFFLTSLWCLWRLLHGFSLRRLVFSALATGALLLSKMSAPIIVPMALAMVVVRLAAGRPLPASLGRWTWTVTGRFGQGLIFAGAIVAHVAVVAAMIWAFYGFRYDAIGQGGAEDRAAMDAKWNQVLRRPGVLTQAASFGREHRLLPEAYLCGFAHVVRYSQERSAFLNGECSTKGWPWFFPYAFLVKTPLTVFAIVVMAGMAAVLRWRGRLKGGSASSGDPKREGPQSRYTGFGDPNSRLWTPPVSPRSAVYQTLPLWLFLAAYWLSAVASHLNIGHRHILPVYPPMFVLAGAAGHWLRARVKPAGVLLVGLALLLAGEVLYRWPNYLAYFNQIVGGPANGYKHLVDSSLDWGQDLPAAKRYLDARGLNGKGNLYYSYFGSSSPGYYGIRAHHLPGFWDTDRERQWEFFPLTGGVYCIHASMLQPVYGVIGAWNTQYEAMYQAARGEATRLLETMNDPTRLADANLTRAQVEVLMRFDELRFGRLRAYLRQRQPDDQINYSILVYRLSDQDVRLALEGPPAELEREPVVPLRNR